MSFDEILDLAADFFFFLKVNIPGSIPAQHSTAQHSTAPATAWLGHDKFRARVTMCTRSRVYHMGAA